MRIYRLFFLLKSLRTLRLEIIRNVKERREG